jgi:uncharacterized radical SAM superfamily protein
VPGASFDLRLQPTLAEPIKLKNATRGSVTNVSAFSLFSKATCTQPTGNPAFWINTAKRNVHSGVNHHKPKPNHQIIEYKNKHHDTCVENPGSGLGQAQRCGELNR